MHFRRIVIGVDFGEASLAAARWIATQASADAELLLVHVDPEPGVPSYVRPHLAPGVPDAAAERGPDLGGALRSVRDLIGSRRARAAISTGAPADVLARTAEEFDADLICVGRGRVRRGSARFGATTPQRLLARSDRPVLVVPRASAGNAAGAPTRVLAAIDERPGGDAVLRTALVLAAPHGAHVDAVHVVEGDLREYARGVSRAVAATRPRPDTAAERLRLIAGDALDDVRLCLLAREWASSRLDAAGALRHRSAPIIRLGDAGQEIVAHAHRTGAGLIVIGRGGPGAGSPSARSSGSTARLVLWAAPCPVLVLPLLDARAESPEPTRDLRRYRQRIAPLVPAIPPRNGNRNGDRRGGGDAA